IVADGGGEAAGGQVVVPGLDADANVLDRVPRDVGIEIVVDEDAFADVAALSVVGDILDEVARDRVPGRDRAVAGVAVDAHLREILNDVVLGGQVGNVDRRGRTAAAVDIGGVADAGGRVDGRPGDQAEAAAAPVGIGALDGEAFDGDVA